MNDPLNQKQADDFVGSNDKTPKFERDGRFIACLADAKPDSWDFGPGDNYFFVLPSSSDFAQFFPDRKADYQIGKSYHQISICRGGERRPRNYRAPRDNELSKAYWRLYESLHGGPEWKEITAGFQAGGDWRRCLNIVVMKPGSRIGPVKMFRVPDERGGQKKPGQQDALYIQIRNALAKAYGRMKTVDPNAWPFFPQHAVLLKLGLSFRGTIPQYNSVDVFEQQGQPFVQDLTAVVGDLSVLDQCAAWCREFDELPKLAECDTVIRSINACRVLGLVPSGAMPQIATAPPVFQQQAAGFPAAAPPVFQPQTGAPTGFGTAPVPPPAAPVAPPAGVPVPPPAAPVNPVIDSAAAGVLFAQRLQQEMSKTPGAPTGGPF